MGEVPHPPDVCGGVRGKVRQEPPGGRIGVQLSLVEEQDRQLVGDVRGGGHEAVEGGVMFPRRVVLTHM